MVGADAEYIKTTDLDELLKCYSHQCVSQGVLTAIQVDLARNSEGLIHMGTCFEELTAQLQEQNTILHQFVESSDARMRFLEVNSSKHTCIKETSLISISADVINIKMQLAALSGETKWTDRIWSIGQSVAVAIVVLLAAFFMKGGSIT